MSWWRQLGELQLPLVPLESAVALPYAVVRVAADHPVAAAFCDAVLSTSAAPELLVATATVVTAGDPTPDADDDHESDDMFQARALASTGLPATTSADRVYTHVTVAKVRKLLRTASDFGRHAYLLTLQGVGRGRLVSAQARARHVVATVQLSRDAVSPPGAATDAITQLRAVANVYLTQFVLRRGGAPDSPAARDRLVVAQAVAQALPTLDVYRLPFLMATILQLSVAQRLRLLAVPDPALRAVWVTTLLQQAIEHAIVLRSEDGGDDTAGADTQSTEGFRDFRQRFGLDDALRDRDGGDDDGDDDGVEALLAQAAALELPPEARKVVDRECRRLQRMNPAQPEYNMLRTFVETVVDLPWSCVTEDTADIAAAEAQLDADHHGLEDVKKRILGFLAVRQLAPDTASGAIICLSGPPGVGKTSLGQSVAKALGRKFGRVALGGVSDEAEIRGHRRTYIGAMPGRIVAALRRAGSRNPVLLLDEVDKLGHGIRGDPAAALLEVLDPAQNSTFTDAYLGLPFDVSQVLFVATANSLATIPGPLLDRMEVIHLDGYTLLQKVSIAATYLVPRQIERNGLPAGALTFPTDVLEMLATAYTREAGVRGLEKAIGAVCRSTAVQLLRDKVLPVSADGDVATSIPSKEVTADDLTAVLGHPPHTHERLLVSPPPGVSTGLAWTPVGGDVLFVEATWMPGSGVVDFTGQLGTVMRESVSIALAWVRAHHVALRLDALCMKDRDLHVHFPAGAVPKDGPSAGLAIVCSLYSLFSGRAVPADVAMTGEVTLAGRVTAVGGIMAKVLAAHRAGIRRIVLPASNAPQVAELPEDVRADVEFALVDTILDGVGAVFSDDFTDEGMPPLDMTPSDVMHASTARRFGSSRL